MTNDPVDIVEIQGVDWGWFDPFTRLGLQLRLELHLLLRNVVMFVKPVDTDLLARAVLGEYSQEVLDVEMFSEVGDHRRSHLLGKFGRSIDDFFPRISTCSSCSSFSIKVELPRKIKK